MNFGLVARLPLGRFLSPLSISSFSTLPSFSVRASRSPSLSFSSLPSRSLCSSSLSLLPPPNQRCFSFPSLSPLASPPPFLSCRFSSSPSSSSSDKVVIDITAQNINEVMQEKGVLVLYCTADWCGPCKKLGPRLEEDIRALPGVRLGKIDIDKEQQLAGAMRIQSIPAVFAFNDGKLINSFVGVPPDEKYQEFFAGLREHAPAQTGETGIDAEQLLKEADANLERGSVEEAAKLYSEVFENYNSKDDDLFGAISLSGLIQCVIKQGEVEAAKGLVSNLKNKYKGCLEHSSVRAALSSFDLMSSSSSSTHTIEELEAVVGENPDKMEEKFELAKLYFSSNRPEESIKTLIDMIKRDRHWNENAAKEQLLKIFEVLGPSHELTISGRRKLTSAWF